MYTPYTVYVGLGPRFKKKALCLFSMYTPYTVYVGLGPGGKKRTLSIFNVHTVHGLRRSRSRREKKEPCLFS